MIHFNHSTGSLLLKVCCNGVLTGLWMSTLNWLWDRIKKDNLILECIWMGFILIYYWSDQFRNGFYVLEDIYRVSRVVRISLVVSSEHFKLNNLLRNIEPSGTITDTLLIM